MESCFLIRGGRGGAWRAAILSAEDVEGRGELHNPFVRGGTGKKGLWTLSDTALAFELAVAAEVEEEADSEAGGFEIVEELGVFVAGELVERLQLDDDLPVTYEVDLVFLGKAMPFVGDVERFFGFKRYAAGAQFDLHGFLIHFFEEARPEGTMQFDGRPGDGIGLILQNQFRHGCRLGPLRTGSRVFMKFFINMSALSAQMRFSGRIWGEAGLFVHVVHAFEEGEEGAEVVLFGGLLADCFDELLASFGAAGVDGGYDLSGVVGHRAAFPVLHAVEVALGEIFFFFGFFSPAAEGAVGDADDGGKVFPGGAGLGGIAEGVEVFLIHGVIPFPSRQVNWMRREAGLRSSHAEILPTEQMF